MISKRSGIVLVIAILFTVFTVGAFAGGAYGTPAETVENKNFDLSGFDSVRLSGFRSFEITQGESYGVRVATEQGLLNSISGSVENGILMLKNNAGGATTMASATITLPNINSLHLYDYSQGSLSGFVPDRDTAFVVVGNSSLDIPEFRTSYNVNLLVSSRGDVRANLFANVVNYDITGQGQLDLMGSVASIEGKTRRGELNISDFSFGGGRLSFYNKSEGNLEMENTRSADVTVRLHDDSKVRIDTLSGIYASVFDNSELTYDGRIKRLQQQDRSTVDTVVNWFPN